MFKKALFVAASLATAVLAGPLDKRQIAARAQWLIHGDVEALMVSKLGQRIQQEAQKPGLAQVVQAIQTTYGLNPLADVKSITLYGTKVGQEEGVAIIQAKLDRQKLVDLLKLNPDYKEHKAGQQVIHEWVDAPKDDKPAQVRFGAFCGSDLAVIASSRDLLQQALAVLDGKADSLAKGESPGLAAPRAGTFLTLCVDKLPQPPADRPEAVLLAKFARACACLGEAEGKLFADVAIEAASQEAADNIRKTVEGGLAFLGLLMPAQGQALPDIPPQLPPLVRSAKVTMDGKTVKLSAGMATEDLIAMLEWAEKHKK